MMTRIFTRILSPPKFVITRITMYTNQIVPNLNNKYKSTPKTWRGYEVFNTIAKNNVNGFQGAYGSIKQDSANTTLFTGITSITAVSNLQRGAI